MTDSPVTLRKVAMESAAGETILPPWRMATESGLPPDIFPTSAR